MYTEECDYLFSETLYDGTWFDGVSQEEMLQEIQCPCVYIKVKTGYGKDGVLHTANDDEAAKRVVDSVKNCRFMTTDMSDHGIHFTYPKRFTKALVDVKKNLRDESN